MVQEAMKLTMDDRQSSNKVLCAPQTFDVKIPSGWKSYKLQASRFRGSNNHCTFDNKVVVPSQVLDSRFAFPSLQSLKP